MTTRTASHAPDKLALKRACDALLDDLGGPLKAQAHCRANFRRLSEYAGLNTDTFMPVDVVADLEDMARGSDDWPPVTRALAARHGLALVRLPDLNCDIADRGVASLLASMGREVAAHGARQSQLLAAVADHVLTDREIDDALPHLDEEIEALVAMRALLQHMRGQ